MYDRLCPEHRVGPLDRKYLAEATVDLCLDLLICSGACRQHLDQPLAPIFPCLQIQAVRKYGCCSSFYSTASLSHYNDVLSFRARYAIISTGLVRCTLMELSRLREWRMRRAMAQRDLAAASHVGLSTINRLEQGLQLARPSTLRRLSQALDVRPEDLFAASNADQRPGAKQDEG